MTVTSQIICIKKIVIISISLTNSNIFKLQNLVLILSYNFNFILFGQLWESRIIYCNDLTVITLIKNGKLIVLIKKKTYLASNLYALGKV